MPNNDIYKPISFQDFIHFIRHFKRIESAEDDLLFKAYCELITLLAVHHDAFPSLPLQPVDHGRLILFLLHDYEFRLYDLPLDRRIEIMNDDEFFTKLATTVVDKYGSESYFKYEENRLIGRFSTEISTLNVYVNFISLKLKQLSASDESDEIYVKLLKKAFSLCRTVNELLIAGFEKEALATWRTLHEVEAVLVLVSDPIVLNAYANHVIFNAALNGLLPQKNSDEIFIKIKSEMKSFNLKSKDTRRFIEYGWISAHPEFNYDSHKFNFRDGVQALAKLGTSRDAYKNASEAAHSSPLLLFIDSSLFLRETLRNLYTSFLVIEALFAAKYSKNAAQNEIRLYHEVRKVYLADINDVLLRLS